MDPKREWDGWSFADIANPAKGEDGYPRLQVENRVYCSRVFRKLHLEVATRQDGLDVLHMVLFPRCEAAAPANARLPGAIYLSCKGSCACMAQCADRFRRVSQTVPASVKPHHTRYHLLHHPHAHANRYDYDLPILALDLVVVGGTVTLAVADACPLSPNLSLPRHYMQTMVELQVQTRLFQLTRGECNAAKGLCVSSVAIRAHAPPHPPTRRRRSWTSLPRAGPSLTGARPSSAPLRCA
jgi:hypothetical protein